MPEVPEPSIDAVTVAIGSAVVALYAAIVATSTFIWNVVNAIAQNRFKNYEAEYRSVETLINSISKDASLYWTKTARDAAMEQPLLLCLDELTHKLESLQASGIMMSAPHLDHFMIFFRQAVTLSDGWQSNNWKPEPARVATIRRSANSLLHSFLKAR